MCSSWGRRSRQQRSHRRQSCRPNCCPHRGHKLRRAKNQRTWRVAPSPQGTANRRAAPSRGCSRRNAPRAPQRAAAPLSPLATWPGLRRAPGTGPSPPRRQQRPAARVQASLSPRASRPLLRTRLARFTRQRKQQHKERGLRATHAPSFAQMTQRRPRLPNGYRRALALAIVGRSITVLGGSLRLWAPTPPRTVKGKILLRSRTFFVARRSRVGI